MPEEKKKEMKLVGVEWVEQPLKRIEFHVGRNAGRGGGRSGRNGGFAGDSRGGGGYKGRGRGDKRQGQRKEREIDTVGETRE